MRWIQGALLLFQHMQTGEVQVMGIGYSGPGARWCFNHYPDALLLLIRNGMTHRMSLKQSVAVAWLLRYQPAVTL